MMVLEELTTQLRAAGRKALVPFLTAGYPTPPPSTSWWDRWPAAVAGCWK